MTELSPYKYDEMFSVEWMPKDEVERKARAAGWTPEEDSIWDFISDDDVTETKEFSTKEAAFSFAKQVFPEDEYGEVSVYRYSTESYIDLKAKVTVKNWGIPTERWTFQEDDAEPDHITYPAE